MNVEFNFVEPKEQIILSLEELKSLNNESVLIKSLPEWLNVNKECEYIEVNRVIHNSKNKISPKKLDLPWVWNERNYGVYWIAYKYI
jgi:hypothetical protein